MALVVKERKMAGWREGLDCMFSYIAILGISKVPGKIPAYSEAHFICSLSPPSPKSRGKQSLPFTH